MQFVVPEQIHAKEAERPQNGEESSQGKGTEHRIEQTSISIKNDVILESDEDGERRNEAETHERIENESSSEDEFQGLLLILIQNTQIS